MDGTDCSEECMRTSIYHKDPSEIDAERHNETSTENSISNIVTANTDIGRKNSESSTSEDQCASQIQNERELEVATTLSSKSCQAPEQTTKIQTERELEVAMTLSSTSCQVPEQTTKITNNQEDTSNSQISSDETPLEVQKGQRKYNVNRAKGLSDLLDDTLPDIETTELDEWKLPGATPTTSQSEVTQKYGEHDPTLNQINETTRDSVSMDINEDLPLLEQPNYFDDMEALMAIENDQDNDALVAIGDPPAVDIIKDLNEALGVNEDLEIAMDNALFIENQNKSVAPSSTQHSTTNKASTSGHQKGTFSTRTHGIRRLTPEEKQDKLFKCEACTFTAYCRRNISEHYQKTHGKVQCPVCQGHFSNPHALKRHMYDHSDEKEFQCIDCDEKFYFNSELTAHRMKHRTNPAFRCMASGCSKTFYRNSDLNAHVPVHSGIIHKCDHPGCTYSNADLRLLKGHKRSHSTMKTFICKYNNCSKSFKHTMSRLRHYRNDHGEM